MLTIRDMTPPEVDDLLRDMAKQYAEQQVDSGRWEATGAIARALRGIESQLPLGAHTPRMLFLAGDDEKKTVGRAWVALDHPDGVPDTAFLHEIVIAPEHRGRGMGRALLAAIEQTLAETGVSHLELTVSASNLAAVSLYSTSGFRSTQQTMRKTIKGFWRPSTAHSRDAPTE